MKTKTISLLAVLTIFGTAFLLSCSEKSIEKDVWQQQSASQGLLDLYKTSVPLLADIISSEPSTRSDNTLQANAEAIQEAIVSLVKESDAIGQMKASGYYKVKPDEDSLLLLAANPYGYAEFVKDNGTPRYAGIIQDLADGKPLKLTKEDIVNDKNMLTVEKIPLLMILAVSNTATPVPMTRGGDCMEQYQSARGNCGVDYGISCGIALGTGSFSAIIGPAIGVAFATYQLDKCLDTANEMYIMCQKLQENQQK